MIPGKVSNKIPATFAAEHFHLLPAGFTTIFS